MHIHKPIDTLKHYLRTSTYRKYHSVMCRTHAFYMAMSRTIEKMLFC